MNQISVIVITHNEAVNLERCLDSVKPFASEIVVVDSASSDGTRAIAARYTDRVLIEPWRGYGPQKQFALEQARCSWVFSIDADEQVSPELAGEITALDGSGDGYLVPRVVWYLNRWIRHGIWYPDPVLRLFRRDRARFTPDPVHERVVLQGSVGRLEGALHHYSYRDIAHHVAKMNEMASLAARQMAERGQRAGWVRLGLKPGWEFLRAYVLERGFLDGMAGFIVAALHAQYTFLKYARLHEQTVLRGNAG
jgi:glycosyltransferase involved in cell wall biosynthesis